MRRSYKYSAPTMRICTTLNEGFTQYLADVLHEQGLPKVERVTYQDEVDCATKLIHEFGFDAVARFYFFGEFSVRGLFEAVTRCADYCRWCCSCGRGASNIARQPTSAGSLWRALRHQKNTR